MACDHGSASHDDGSDTKTYPYSNYSHDFFDNIQRSTQPIAQYLIRDIKKQPNTFQPHAEVLKLWMCFTSPNHLYGWSEDHEEAMKLIAPLTIAECNRKVQYIMQDDIDQSLSDTLIDTIYDAAPEEAQELAMNIAFANIEQEMQPKLSLVLPDSGPQIKFSMNLNPILANKSNIKFDLNLLTAIESNLSSRSADGRRYTWYFDVQSLEQIEDISIHIRIYLNHGDIFDKTIPILINHDPFLIQHNEETFDFCEYKRFDAKRKSLISDEIYTALQRINFVPSHSNNKVVDYQPCLDVRQKMLNEQNL
tara:strand:- start:1220 stop:2140 length:921 start_codon:yes stop_codon:yes gene_type:complete